MKKKDYVVLTEKGNAIFQEAIARVEKAFKEWREFQEKRKNRANSKKSNVVDKEE